MKKILLIIIFIFCYNISFDLAQSTYNTEDILGMKCEIGGFGAPNIDMNNITLSNGLNDLSFSYLYKENSQTYFYNNFNHDFSVKYKIPDDFFISKYTMGGKGNILIGDNNKVIVYNKDNKFSNTFDNRFLEYEKIKKFEHENYDFRDEDSYIFLGKHIIKGDNSVNNIYSLVINGEENYTFTLDNGINFEEGIIFSENGKHFITGYKKNNKWHLIFDGEITEGYDRLGGEPKIDNYGNYTYIAEKEGNYEYIVNGTIKLKFKYNEDDNSIEIIEGELKGKKIDANNFHLEIVDKDFYIFGILYESSTLEIIKNLKLLKSYNNIIGIGLEQLTIDGNKYSLIVQNENKKDSLLYLIDGKINLSEFQFDNIYYANVVFSNKSSSIIFTGSNRKFTGDHSFEVINESVILNDKIIGKYKKVENNFGDIKEIGFDENDNIFYKGIDLDGNIFNIGPIKYTNFNYKINKDLSDVENKIFIYDIYYLNKKILTSKTNIDNYERSWNNNDYILAKKDLNNKLIIYKNGKYINLNIGELSENIFINTGLSPDGKKYYILIKDRDTKEIILIDNGKIIKGKTINVGINPYIKDFGSDSYNFVYSQAEKNENGKLVFNYFIDGKNIGKDFKTFSMFEVGKGSNYYYKNIVGQNIDGKEYIYINGNKSKIGFDKIYDGIIIKGEKEILKFLANYNNKVKLYFCDINNYNNVNKKVFNLKLKSKVLFFKDLILSKKSLENSSKGEMFKGAVDKRVYSLSDEKLVQFYNIVGGIDLNSNKYRKYKLVLEYMKAKIGMEIWKRDGIEKEEISKVVDIDNKIYVNNEYNYEFSYPKEWQMSESQVWNGDYIPDSRNMLGIYTNGYPAQDHDGRIDVYNIDIETVIKDNQFIQYALKDNNVIKEIIINGIKWTNIKGKYVDYYLTEVNGKTYSVNINEVKANIILKSFKINN